MAAALCDLTPTTIDIPRSGPLTNSRHDSGCVIGKSEVTRRRSQPFMRPRYATDVINFFQPNHNRKASGRCGLKSTCPFPRLLSNSILRRDVDPVRAETTPLSTILCDTLERIGRGVVRVKPVISRMPSRRFFRWRSSVLKLKPRLWQNSLRGMPLLRNSATNS